MSNLIFSQNLTRVEINKKTLTHNIKTLRMSVGKKCLLAPAVKANAYGHGLVIASQIMLRAGADWLCINSIGEERALRAAGIRSPIYIMGYVQDADLPEAAGLGCRMVVYNEETLKNLARAAWRAGVRAKIHIKVETGNNRQGIAMEELVAFAHRAASLQTIEIEGVCTHFANIEDVKISRGDRLPHYALKQLKNFQKANEMLEAAGIYIPILHTANSAATLLFPATHFNMVRPGIVAYGMWPSQETRRAAEALHKGISLEPALRWLTKIAQVKHIQKNARIGYGCTYRAPRPMKLAILPVGYYDGYDRKLSNKAHVLIHGKRAPVRGRVCMNIIMVDVTDIPNVAREDTVTLLGRDGAEEITAEYIASLSHTINYEVTTKINETIPRILVP